MISHFIPHIIVEVITHPCWGYSVIEMGLGTTTCFNMMFSQSHSPETQQEYVNITHDDFMTWNHFTHYLSFVREGH